MAMRSERHRQAVIASNKLKRIHGARGTPLYNIWCNMRQRCLNPKQPSFHNYGGRGISIDPRWNCFLTFCADVGPRPTESHTLDRYPDMNGNYEPGNVRWATRREQMSNVRYNVMITHGGETATMTEWSRRVGISPSQMHQRLKKWTPEKAVTTPNLKPYLTHPKRSSK